MLPFPNDGSGSNCDLQQRLALRLECDGEPTFGPERRQFGGFRPFKRSGLNSRFVPEADIVLAEQA